MRTVKNNDSDRKSDRGRDRFASICRGRDTRRNRDKHSCRKRQRHLSRDTSNAGTENEFSDRSRGHSTVRDRDIDSNGGRHRDR